VPPQATVGPYAHGRTLVRRAERTPAHRCVCEKPNYELWGVMSTPRADRLLGLPLTHDSRHVDSTFKRLTTATTHCDLIKLLSTQTGFLPRS
jgi:hypothetical protein